MHWNNVKMNYYDVLGVRINANPQEIKQAYRSCVKKWHPDKFVDPLEKDNYQERCKLVNEAYSVLSDNDKRKIYDANLFDAYSPHLNSNNTDASVTVSKGTVPVGFTFCLKIFLVVLAALSFSSIVRHVGIRSNTVFITIFFLVFFLGCFLIKRIRPKRLR